MFIILNSNLKTEDDDEQKLVGNDGMYIYIFHTAKIKKKNGQNKSFSQNPLI